MSNRDRLAQIEEDITLVGVMLKNISSDLEEMEEEV